MSLHAFLHRNTCLGYMHSFEQVSKGFQWCQWPLDVRDGKGRLKECSDLLFAQDSIGWDVESVVAVVARFKFWEFVMGEQRV